MVLKRGAERGLVCLPVVCALPCMDQPACWVPRPFSLCYLASSLGLGGGSRA